MSFVSADALRPTHMSLVFYFITYCDYIKNRIIEMVLLKGVKESTVCFADK